MQWSMNGILEGRYEGEVCMNCIVFSTRNVLMKRIPNACLWKCDFFLIVLELFFPWKNLARLPSKANEQRIEQNATCC